MTKYFAMAETGPQKNAGGNVKTQQRCFAKNNTMTKQ